MSHAEISEAELTARVVSIITTQQKLPAGRVTPESTFEELGIDSLDGVSLLFVFEEEFDITIPEHVAQKMRDVRQVVAGLQQVLKARSKVPSPSSEVESSELGP